jgi:ferredoxin-type protein NapH
MIGWAGRNKWLLTRRSVQVLVILLLLSPAFGLGIFSGTLISGELFGVTLTDPLAAIDYSLAAKTVSLSLAIGAAIVLAFYFVVGGRVFCSWVCPIHLISEIGRNLHRRTLGATPPKRAKQKYWVLALVVVLSFVTSKPVFETISPIGAITQNIATGVDYHGSLFGPGNAGEANRVLGGADGVVLSDSGGTWRFLFNSSLLFVLFIFLVEVFVRKGWWCEYTCPVGALYSIVGRRSPARVRMDHEACNHCGDCFKVCIVPDVLKPPAAGTTDWVLSGDCSNCMSCVDACTTSALSLRFSIGGKK